MIAHFKPIDAAHGTIYQQAQGEAITVTLPTGKRVVLLLSTKDADKVRDVRKMKACLVTDLMTGQEHALVPSTCGAGCRCAVAFAGVR